MIGLIPLGIIAGLFVFDLFTWRKPLLVTVLGGFLFWASDPVSDWIIAMPVSQHITYWAQHRG
jgi:hypothetical protein